MKTTLGRVPGIGKVQNCTKFLPERILIPWISISKNQVKI